MVKKVCMLILSMLLCLQVSIKAQAYVQIPHVSSKIIIDGIADNTWNDVQENQITYLIDGASYPTASDLSGYFKAFWNRDTLYVLIHAIDNVLYTGDSTVFYNDGFEIYLDVVNLKAKEYNDSCYQFRFIPGSSEITGRWGLNVWTPPSVDFAIHVEANNNRTLEAVFPIKQLGRQTSLAIGDKMGFEVEILDNDGSGRNHVLSWNNNQHMAWYDPSKMGTIECVETVSQINKIQLQDVTLFPNPTSGFMSVKSASSINELSIFSIQGQLIFERKGTGSNEMSLDLSSFKPGLYLMKIKLDDNKYLDCEIVRR